MPNDPPPNPSNPPNSTYTSTCGANFSSWDGSFTYNNGTIAYTLKGQTTPLPSTTNTSSGNAIVLKLTDTSITPTSVQFNGPTFKWEGPDNQGQYKAQYSGNCERQGPGAGLDDWTATQTS